jgi:hypothetical protein
MFFQTKPPGFRKWLDLENKKSTFLEAVESEAFPDKVYAYLSTALAIPVKRLDKKSWENTVRSLLKESIRFIPSHDLPILRDAPKDSKPVDWDYPERTWFFYSHMLAKAYGWTLEYIAKLGVNEALAYLQEILTDDHLDREFEYGLSEMAYPYNKSSKKSEFKPMKRPYWMKQSAPKEIKRFKIRRDSLPVGRIVDISGLPAQYAIEGLEVERPK